MSDTQTVRLFPGLANWMKFIYWHPCAEPFTILLETLIPCVIELFIEAVTYDIGQFTRDSTRFGVRELGPSRSLRRHLGVGERDNWGSEAKGRELRSEKGVAKTVTRSAAQTMMTVTDNLEGLLFVFLLYSVVDDFFYNWTSLLYKRQYCSADPSTGPLIAHLDHGYADFNIEGTSFPFTYVDQNRAGWSYNGVSAALPSGQYDVAMSMQAVGVGTNPPTAFLRLWATFPWGSVLIAEGAHVEMKQGQRVGLSLGAHIDARFVVDVSIYWETCSEDAPVGANEFYNAKLMIYESSWMDSYEPL